MCTSKTGQFQLGFVLLWVERLEDAVEAFRECIRTYRLCGDAVTLLRGLVYLGLALRRLGREEEVRQCLEEAQSLADQLRVPDYQGLIAAQRGWLAWREGDRGEAAAHSRQALDIWRASAPRYPVKWSALWVLIALAADEGNVAAAARLVEQMRDPSQARPAPAMEEALLRVSEARSAGDDVRLREELSTAVRMGAEAGML